MVGERTGRALEQIGGARALGETLRELRGRAGLSQRAVAIRIGMHPNYYGAIERGGSPNPGLATVDRIAHGLEVGASLLAAAFARRPPAQLSLLPAIEPLFAAIGAGRAPDGSRAPGGAETMGTAIRRLRSELGISQEELARASGLHRGHLAIIEAGGKPSPGLRTVTKIAYGLGERGPDPAMLTARLAQIFAGELTLGPSLPDRPAPPMSP
jgi:transcriptional regulator with XRE-family HTH domain